MSSITGKVEEKLNREAAPLLPIPAFSDIAKAANDVSTT